jgi:hypothetical protein
MKYPCFYCRVPPFETAAERDIHVTNAHPGYGSSESHFAGLIRKYEHRKPYG